MVCVQLRLSPLKVVCLDLWGTGVPQPHPVLYDSLNGVLSCSCEGSKVRHDLCHDLGDVTLSTFFNDRVPSISLLVCSSHPESTAFLTFSLQVQ